MKLRYIGENCTLNHGEICEVRVRLKRLSTGSYYILVTALNLDFGSGCVGTWNCRYDSISSLAEHWEVPN